jgi:hypothetical protein
VSGDGGYNEVVDGVMQAGDTGTVCAVMAAGNANDHRRTTGTVFRRGEKPIQLVYNGPAKEEPSRANPTMWPISDRGPFYAALVTGGTLDTKGGPRTNPDGQVLDDTGGARPGPVRGRQPRRLGVRAGLLGGRGDPRPDHPLRPPGRTGRQPGTGNRPADPGLTPSRGSLPGGT